MRVLISIVIGVLVVVAAGVLLARLMPQRPRWRRQTPEGPRLAEPQHDSLLADPADARSRADFQHRRHDDT